MSTFAARVSGLATGFRALQDVAGAAGRPGRAGDAGGAWRMRALDHLVVTAPTLEAGAAHVAKSLCLAPGPGGRHARMATHNRLLGLGPGLYLEVIAVDPSAPAAAVPRWFDLDRFAGPPRLGHWVLRCDDLAAELAAMPAGSAAIRAEDFARGPYRWRMAVSDDGRLPFGDAHPGLIEWRAGGHPADRLADNGLRLERLEISHPEAAALRAALRLDDRRVVVKTGPQAMRAVIATPVGPRLLD